MTTLGTKFEKMLLAEEITRLGMTYTREPQLLDGKRPDYLVEHDGRKCYVEATHIAEPQEIATKRGEADLVKILKQYPSQGWVLRLAYPNEEKRRLTDPLSQNEKAAKAIIAWLEKLESTETKFKTRTFHVRGITVCVLASYMSHKNSEEPSTTKAGWYKSDNNRWQKLINKNQEVVREKYQKYTDTPRSLGDTPLIIALLHIHAPEFTEMALYGEGTKYIKLNRQRETMETGIKHNPNGTWWNNHDGKGLQKKNHHLAAVWLFTATDPREWPPTLYVNPFREDIDNILPKPLLQIHREPTVERKDEYITLHFSEG